MMINVINKNIKILEIIYLACATRIQSAIAPFSDDMLEEHGIKDRNV